jgi:hypothetical protein
VGVLEELYLGLLPIRRNTIYQNWQQVVYSGLVG